MYSIFTYSNLSAYVSNKHGITKLIKHTHFDITNTELQMSSPRVLNKT